MDGNFFAKKRPWSRYKDYLLENYLDPYLAKVSALKRPILIVDCFAGRGRIDDGESGSPLIIAEAISRWRLKGNQIKGHFIEADERNFKMLQSAIQDHSAYCTISHGSFQDWIPTIAKFAQSHTVFLYVDPYSVRGLDFDGMKSVHEHIRKSSSSVEMLLNFNVAIFMRWALAALKRQAEINDEEIELLADNANENVERKTLNQIAGGDYWVRIAEDDAMPFEDKIKTFMSEYSKRLLESFKYVCRFAVKEKYRHHIPKYLMVFATRHPDGVLLMNDNMCKARRNFVTSQLPKNVLFDLTPDEEIVDSAHLDAAIAEVFQTNTEPLNREELRLSLFRQGFFARLTNSEINHHVGEMLKSRRLYSATGKSRINDSVDLGLTPFKQP